VTDETILDHQIDGLMDSTNLSEDLPNKPRGYDEEIEV
jgi:hypothetical protein